MIHVDDLCRIISILAGQFRPGPILISDGKPLRWQEIAKAYKFNLQESSPGLESRSFDTTKLTSLLPEDFTFRTAY